VRRQIDIGLDVVTDGEFRRWMFMNSFYDHGQVPFLLAGNEYVFIPADLARKFNSSEWLMEAIRSTRQGR
jgi:methionine synthase II (cobalamin-independent)